MSGEKPILEIKDLTFTYAGAETPALKNINLQIFEGEYVALLGLNGSGKTTLQLCINAVIPHMIMGDMEGSVTVQDLDTAEYPTRELAKIVGVVFDNPEFQLSQMSVAEEIALGLENLGVAVEEMNPIIHEVLDIVGLSGLGDRSPFELSGGQQQRLSIAAALAMRPQILVMDEPTSNVDPIGKEEVFAVAAKLNRERKMTVIMAEHEVEVMAAYANRIIVMDHGEVILNGTPTEVFSQLDVLEKAGLRVPQVTEMAYRLEHDRSAHWNSVYPVTTEEAFQRIAPLFGGKHD
ncbi:energy-coupling factor ABC transporter ATP-binding protein [Levilinea saccharolytica]|uniref:Cobalt ABC transporter ATPase n=1 Tax=Levilinea saccharolytica TaxID=229921 RepID=A0A0P6YXW9_9CHLR|nr:ABC transporter ATP-binding protein [Levilinea saccharolytica]KPL90086.1 cobalt ABC transporter ATPase [Levilinea saccharolytica]GAP16166.1 ABC-type cobalt transport system, ATPase component [Levilinea saccharolytica]